MVSSSFCLRSFNCSNILDDESAVVNRSSSAVFNFSHSVSDILSSYHRFASPSSFAVHIQCKISSFAPIIRPILSILFRICRIFGSSAPLNFSRFDKHLLKGIYHKKFIHKQKLHKSANCTSINIIDGIELEIKIQQHKTIVVADVATNLITDLLLGNDWITENNVIIDPPQQRIFLTDGYHRTIATTRFTQPTDSQSPILLIDEITLPPYSEKCIDVKLLSSRNNTNEVLFEPAPKEGGR